MNSPYFQELYNKKVLFYKIIWGVLTIQGFFFTGIIFINIELVQGVKINNPNIESLLTVGALILAITSYSIRKHFLSERKIQETINVPIHSEDLVNLTQYRGNFKQILAKVETLNEYEKRAINLIHYSFIPNLISWMLNQVILFFGLTIAYSINDPFKIIPFALSHFALNLFMFPNIDQLLARSKSLYKAT